MHELPVILGAVIETVELPFGTYRFAFEPKNAETDLPAATMEPFRRVRGYIDHPVFHLRLLSLHLSLATQEALVSAYRQYEGRAGVDMATLPAIMEAPVETVDMAPGTYRILCEPV